MNYSQVGKELMLPEKKGKIEDIYYNQLKILTNKKSSSDDYSILHKIARLQYQVGMEYHWIEDFAIRKNYFDLALGNINKILSENDTFGRAYAEKAMILYRRNDLSEALKLLNESERLDPSYAYVQAYKGGIIYNQGDHTKASTFFQRALEMDESCSEAWVNLGNYHFFIQKNYQKACECYRKASELLPFFSSAVGKLGHSYMSLQNFSQAKSALTKSVEILPGYGNLMLLSEVYIFLEKKVEALNTIELGMRKYPNKPYFKEKHQFMMLSDEELLIKADKVDDPIELYNIALRFARKNRHDIAIRLYNQTIELDPDSYSAWKDLANIYMDLGNKDRGSFSLEQRWGFQSEFKTIAIGSKQKELFKKSLDAFEKAINLLEKENGQKDFHLLFNYTNALRLNNKQAESKEQLLKLVDEFPQQSVFPLINLMSVFFEEGKYNEAYNKTVELLSMDIEVIDEDINPIKAMIYFQQAQALIHLNRMEEVIKSLEKAIEMDKNLKDMARQNPLFKKYPEVMELLKPKLDL